MRRVLGLALAFSLSMGAAALAQEAIPTAGGAQSNVSPHTAAGPAGADADLQPYDEFADGPLGPKMGPCGPLETADGKPDHSAHGEIHAGVGTHGYRNIGGAVCKPIGDNGAIAIAIDKTDGDYGYGRRWR
ncbi:hypothetical protein ACO2Q3_20380 [Caulobacter sp. KR2-114]|uniref:hypothetical protein n=1 Tax=Caulobacter sp. KR2-114 TaxID=3400912 RepID=UPI003C04EA67